MSFVFKSAREIHGVERAFFEDGKGNMMVCTLREVVEIAADPSKTDSVFSASPTQQQAQEALEVLGLQMN